MRLHSYPWVGSYSKDFLEAFEKGDFLEGCECEPGIFSLRSSNYGVSLHGSSAYFYLSPEELIKEGVLEVISDAKAEEIIGAKEDLIEAEDDLCLHEMAIEFARDKDALTEEALDKWTMLIVQEIRAKTNYIVATM